MYDRAASDEPEFRVLIMRQWPRGVRKERVDAWLKDAGPSRELLGAYNRHEIAWSEFEQRYRDEILHERPWVLDEIRQLQREHGHIRLLCFERIPPAEHCHRQTLLALLGEA